jgi:hypothetical protein
VTEGRCQGVTILALKETGGDGIKGVGTGIAFDERNAFF